MKKTVMLLLAVCMMLVLIPAAAYAEEEEQATDGMVLTQEQDAEMTLQDGEERWEQDPETKNWKYWKVDHYLTYKQPIAGSWYYFDGNGVLQTKWVMLTDGTKNYYDPTGDTPGVAESTYGCILTGWQTISKKKYYFKPTDKKDDDTIGEMYVGIKTIKGSKYYFDGNGVMQTGWKTVDGNKYYCDPKTGKMKTGWLKLSGKKYYFNPKTAVMKTGWVKIDKDKYYFNTKGVMQTGWKTISGKKYYLGTNGKMVTGFKTIKKKKYYFNSSGVMQKGLTTIKGYKYYFDTSSGVMKTGAKKISGKLYYFFSSGKAVKNTGWFKGSDKKQRYSLGGGVVATGQKKIGNTIYVFSSTTGVLIRSMDQYDSKIQSKSSKTKYLIQVIKSTHQVRVYSGKKNSWTRIYTFACSIGDKEHPTPTGNYKIYKKTQKHEQKNISGVKTRCWGLCKFFKDSRGQEFALNSILYNAATGDVYDGRLGANCTGGSVRTAYNNAMWMYYNCPINTAVIVNA